MKPLVIIGREGITDGVVHAVDEGLFRHELIKIKFNEFKEKHEKKAITEEIAARTGGEVAGGIGHTVLLYRPQADPEKRKIRLPVK